VTSGSNEDEETDRVVARLQVPVAQPLFPSWLCSVVPLMLHMLEDSEVNHDGIAGGLLAISLQVAD